MSKHYLHQLILPANADETLFLIAEELKITRFFTDLHKSGFTDSAFEPHLSELILLNLGLNDGEEKTITFYVNALERRSRKISNRKSSVMKQALKLYADLITFKNEKNTF